MNGRTRNGSLTGSLLLAASLLTAHAVDATLDVVVPAPPGADRQFYRLVAVPANAVERAVTTPPIESSVAAPILVSATSRGIKATLTFTHPTATAFSVRIAYQDEGQASVNVCLVPVVATSPLPGVWSAIVKLQGDTNRLSVCASGSTNRSNELVVVP